MICFSFRGYVAVNCFLARILVAVIIYVKMKSHHSPLENGGHSGNHME
jgi:hypothetical protein